jgi:hypothetical protein
MQQTQAMIVAICHPHAPCRHGHHTPRFVELPERRAPAAPSSRALQLTGSLLHTNTPRLDVESTHDKMMTTTSEKDVN